MSLAYVVEERSFDRQLVPSTGLDHSRGRVEAVTLVGRRLGQEDLSQLRREPSANSRDLVIVERCGEQDVEEAPGQVAQRAGHSLARGLGLAVDAEDGFWSRLETGRRDLLATAVTGPIGPCGDMT